MYTGLLLCRRRSVYGGHTQTHKILVRLSFCSSFRIFILLFFRLFVVFQPFYIHHKRNLDANIYEVHIFPSCRFHAILHFFPLCISRDGAREREREKLPILFTLTHVSISSISERNMANDQDHTQYTRHSDTLFSVAPFLSLEENCKKKKWLTICNVVICSHKKEEQKQRQRWRFIVLLMIYIQLFGQKNGKNE